VPRHSDLDSLATVMKVQCHVNTKHVDQRSIWRPESYHVRSSGVLAFLPLAQPLNPLSNFTTSQLLTQHSPLNTTHDCLPPAFHQTTQTNTLFLIQPFPGKENSNCVLCPPRSKTSSPSVCPPNFPTTSGPDRLPLRLDSVAWTSSTLTLSLYDCASSEHSSCLPGVRVTQSADRRRHILPTLADSCVPHRPLRRSR
jgi:hypothetical protein